MFDEIVGNEKNKRILKNIVEKNSISHSYMFIGQEGIGKMLFAKEFAKALLCFSNEGKPCNFCNSCIKFENDNHPDIIILNEENDSIKTEYTKDLIKNVLEKPIVSERKVYIINNSENMTSAAQNSLLKTLEEPPEYITIILITKSENRLLNTISSRCTKIKFDNLNKKELTDLLAKKGYNNTEKIEVLINISEGSIGNALMLEGKEDIYLEAENIFTNLSKINIIDLLKSKDKIFKDKNIIEGILNYINIIFSKRLNEDIQNNTRYIECIKYIEQTKERLKKNSNYDMTIDNLLFNVWEAING